MKTLVAMVTTVLVVGAPGSANGQVPESYRGVWVINAAGTASRIASDPSMAPENKPGWTERWLASGAGLDITSDEISLHGLEGGSISLAVTLAEDIVDGTLVSAIFPGPSGQEGMRVSVELRLAGGGNLNLRIREENDFDLVVWERADAIAAESGVEPLGGAIDYLNHLSTCEPGEFRFSVAGFGTYSNTILGRDGDRCRVRTQHAQLTLTCDFSQETITLLTSESKVEEARSGNVSGSTDAEESRRMAEECRPG